MADYIDHPRIVENTLEHRTYQQVIAAEAVDENTICILPTGLGKTAVGILLAAHILDQDSGSSILVVAPTRPLTEQHKGSFDEALRIDTDIYQVMTGDTRPEKREEHWKEIGAFFATPQVVENDIIADRIDLSRFSLIIFDECHRATGDYPYSFIADAFTSQRQNGRILGLTASPGSDTDTIKQVMQNLHITNIEVRTEDDPDVEPYIQRREVNWIKVQLDRHFKKVKRQLEAAKQTRVKPLKESNFLSGRANRGQLLKVRSKIRKQLSQEQKPELYQAISQVAGAMKADHCLELLETQGVDSLYSFIQKTRKDPGSKAAKQLLEDENFRNAAAVVEWMVKREKHHPKLTRLKELLQNKMTGDDTAIVFTQYRDTVDTICDVLGDIAYITPQAFKGQKDGFTQQKQLEILDEFRDGAFNVLVSTSVGEEGLDIPAVDYVVFYEPIPSEIRTIQRRGRTGRQEAGHVYVLMAEDTRDEAYYWSSHQKEKKMQAALKELKDESLDMDGGTDTGGQQTMDRFAATDSGLVIYADDRENSVAKVLSSKDVTVRTKRLELADFLVSNRTAVERKTAADFIDSIIDNRLFEQLQELQEQFPRPVLIIEGDSLYTHRNIHQNAIRGALSSVALDYDIPVLWSDGDDETADLLVAMAKREQEDHDRTVSIRGERKPTSETQLQKYIVSGLPNVSDTLAERLLNEFGSVREVFAASAARLQDIDGIGDGKANRIADILDQPFND